MRWAGKTGTSRQRVRGGNSLQVSYTLSRALWDGVGREATLRSQQRPSIDALHKTGRSYEYGYNPIDNRHNLAISASLALPYGVQMSAIARAISGSPLAATCGCDLDGDTILLDRPVGLPPTVGRGDRQRQLDVINAYRAMQNLAAFALD